MTDDVFTEVSHQSWFGRIGGAVVGVLVGVVFLLISFVLLFWNGGRAVHRVRDIKEFAAAAVTIDPAGGSARSSGARLAKPSGSRATAQPTLALTRPAFGRTTSPGGGLAQQMPEWHPLLGNRGPEPR